MKKPKLELFLFPWEIDSMDEYSTSLPSATTIGKVWKANINWDAYNRPDSSNPVWRVYMYGEHEDPNKVYIIPFDVVTRHGPAPRTYTAPDWSFYAGWLREREEERARGHASL